MATSTIPSADQVETRKSRPNYRFSNGTICTGRGENIREVSKLVGELRRVGIYKGTTQDGEIYEFLEIDLDTSEGLVHVHTNLGSRVASLGFACGLLEIGKDELMALDAGRSNTFNRYKRYTTYVNVYKVDPKTLESKTVGRRERKDGEDLEDLLTDALADITTHPAYAPRVSQADVDEASSESAGLTDEIIANRIWADPMKFKAKYMELAGECWQAIHKQKPAKPFDDWGQVPQDVIDMLRKEHREKRIPKILKGLDPAPEAGAQDEYDPFADE